MNQQDKQELNNQPLVIEDLTVNEEQAEEVKGGSLPSGDCVTVTDSDGVSTYSICR